MNILHSLKQTSLNGNYFLEANKLIYFNVISSYFTGIFLSLSEAEKYYPNFKNWFFQKVVPGVARNQRNIILECRNNRVVGIAIIKQSTEKKLSTLRVLETYQNKGIGLKLFEKSFTALETEKPFFTVSEEKLPEFKRIIDYYGFKLTSTRHGLYREGKKEFFFNEE